MKRMDLPERHRAHREKRKQLSSLIPTPWGNADDCQNKGVGRQESCKHMKTRDVGGQAGKAIRTPRGSGQASMKTKGRQSGGIESDAQERLAEGPRYATERECRRQWRRSARKREPSA